PGGISRVREGCEDHQSTPSATWDRATKRECSMWLLILIVGIMASTAGCIFAAFVSFDRLLRIEHGNFPDRWVADGRPVGMFWTPPGRSRYAASLATSFIMFAWLFQTPDWVVNEPQACRLLARMRQFTFASWAGSFALFFTIIGIIAVAVL